MVVTALIIQVKKDYRVERLDIGLVVRFEPTTTQSKYGRSSD